MRIFLRLAAAVILLGTAIWWVRTGRNTGWTKNSVAVEQVDEITGISYPVYEDRFVPGIDVLGAACLAALFLAGISFLRRRSPRPPVEVQAAGPPAD